MNHIFNHLQGHIAGVFRPRLLPTRSGEAAFSPLSLFANSEQGAWYDPSDFASMFQDSAGTTPVTAVEQPVGKINDKSGNGNHATQATAAARPVVSARVNLLRYTEDLSNGVWEDVSSGVTAKTYGQTDPLGGTTAVKLVGNHANTWFAQNSGAVQAADYTLSMWIRADAPVTLDMLFSYGATDLVSVNVTTAWQRFSVTAARAATVGLFAGLNVGNGNNIYVWRPQVEISSTATTYQRVTTASDYDTAGFPHYLLFDGIDDSLSIPATILLSADQVTEWHGALRIPGGGDVAVLCDFGNSGGGTETMEPFSGDGNYYSAFMNNERPGFGALASGVAYVMSELKDTTSLSVRLNGAQMGSVAAVTSKLGTAPAICRTSGSVWTGRVYLIIIRGALSTTQEIENAEAYVASKSGVTL